MIKKVLILTAAMLVSANLFCDITIENQTPHKVIAYVEGVSKIIQPKQAQHFKVTVQAGKTLDGKPISPGDTMAKWVVLNEKPIVYRSIQIELPIHLTIKPDGRNYWTKSWYGKAGLNLRIGDKFWGTRFYGLDRTAEISTSIDTPLTEACLKNDLNLAKKLLDEGLEKFINTADNNGNTPLIAACSANNLGMVKLLLEKGAKESINKANTSGQTPISLAIENQNPDLIKLLLKNGTENGAAKQFIEDYGYILIWLATIVFHDVEMTKLLLDNGAKEIINKRSLKDSSMHINCIPEKHKKNFWEQKKKYTPKMKNLILSFDNYETNNYDRCFLSGELGGQKNYATKCISGNGRSPFENLLEKKKALDHGSIELAKAHKIVELVKIYTDLIELLRSNGAIAK